MLANLFSTRSPTPPINRALKSNYRDTATFEKRKVESTNVRIKHPDRVPVICEVIASSSKQIQLDRHKYLVSGEVTVGQFLVFIRKKIQIGPEQAIYMFNDSGSIPVCSQLMSVLYHQQKNPDGFLYFGLAVENTFG